MAGFRRPGYFVAASSTVFRSARTSSAVLFTRVCDGIPAFMFGSSRFATTSTSASRRIASAQSNPASGIARTTFAICLRCAASSDDCKAACASDFRLGDSDSRADSRLINVPLCATCCENLTPASHTSTASDN
jgi:hypothetical protein